MGDFFRDPAWNSVGVIIAILSLAVTVYLGAYRPARHTARRRQNPVPITQQHAPLSEQPLATRRSLKSTLSASFHFVPSTLFAVAAFLLSGIFGALTTGRFTVFFHSRPVTVLALLHTNGWTFWQLARWLADINNRDEPPQKVEAAGLVLAGLVAVALYYALGAFTDWVLAPSG